MLRAEAHFQSFRIITGGGLRFFYPRSAKRMCVISSFPRPGSVLASESSLQYYREGMTTKCSTSISLKVPSSPVSISVCSQASVCTSRVNPDFSPRPRTDSLKASSEEDSPSAGISLSPPFVTSLSVSPTGIVAAGSANGRLWMGFGGQKGDGSGKNPKKKQKYWQGLKMQENSAWKEVAHGPVVGVYVVHELECPYCSAKLIPSFPEVS